MRGGSPEQIRIDRARPDWSGSGLGENFIIHAPREHVRRSA